MHWPVQFSHGSNSGGQSIDSTAGGSSTPLSVRARNWPADLHVLTYWWKVFKAQSKWTGQCEAAHWVSWVQAVANCRGAGAERVAQVLVLATESESGLENFLHPVERLRLHGKWRSQWRMAANSRLQRDQFPLHLYTNFLWLWASRAFLPPVLVFHWRI